jgi:hypothetical protein
MKVTVTRSGGFAGLTRVWSVQIEAGSELDEWQELIDRLPWSDAASLTGEPDRFVYRVKCNRQRAVIPERRLTGPWRELVDRVQAADTAQRPADGGDSLAESDPSA